MKEKNYVVITGASSGIGYELAVQWANNSHHVICIARNTQKLEKLKSLFPDLIHTIAFDLAEVSQYHELKSSILSITDKIDVLYNNAGLLINKPFEEITPEEFDQVITVNYKAPYFLIQSLLPLIEKSNLKAILNISSVGGIDNTEKFPGLSIYSSSKGALSTLTECLAKDIPANRCRINCLALGAVQTEMLEKAFPGYIPNITGEKMAKFIYDFTLINSQIMHGKVVQVAGVDV